MITLQDKARGSFLGLAVGDALGTPTEGKNPDEIPSVLVRGHGPFSWGSSPAKAVHNAVVLENIAKLAFRNTILGHSKSIDKFLLDKHYLRKHGKDAYYGQN